MRTVYLAGPINGCTDAEARLWRERVKSVLTDVRVLDPMSRDYRGIEDSAVREIVEGDKADILDSDVVLAMCDKPSIGTAMEIYFSYQIRVPVIAVVPEGRPVSPWLRYHATVVRSLGVGLDAVSRCCT